MCYKSKQKTKYNRETNKQRKSSLTWKEYHLGGGEAFLEPLNLSLSVFCSATLKVNSLWSGAAHLNFYSHSKFSPAGNATLTDWSSPTLADYLGSESEGISLKYAPAERVQTIMLTCFTLSSQHKYPADLRHESMSAVSKQLEPTPILSYHGHKAWWVFLQDVLINHTLHRNLRSSLLAPKSCLSVFESFSHVWWLEGLP